jgi:SecD/SecF fusion protein
MFKRILVFVGMLALIGGLIAVAFTGLDLNFIEIPSVADGIIPGLDLSGGTILTYQAPDEIESPDMSAVEQLLRQRLTALGFTEASLYPYGNRGITIEIPNIHDPGSAVDAIGSTAQLEFRTVADITVDQFNAGGFGDEYKLYVATDHDGNPVGEPVVHKVWVTGSGVSNARARYGQTDQTSGSQHYVELEFDRASESGWTEATKFAANRDAQGHSDNYIALFMDDKPVRGDDGREIAPTVSKDYATTGIGREAIVTFGRDAQGLAREFATIVNIGKLPFDLTEVQRTVVGPTLGATALETSLIAGIIGLALMILFMLFYYRLPGLMAAIALLLYTAMIALILALMKVNLSLPGIAGIILSIGMATDANIVIFERIKEELRAGKTVLSAVDAGFKRARTAIIDSNITTMIAGFVLLMFGTGPIKGFATTLLVGVALSMFTALVVTKMLLGQMAGLGVVKLWFYGVREDLAEPKMQTNNFSYVKNFKFFGIPSLLICLFTVVALIMGGFGVNLFNTDIDFTGGTSFQIDIGKDVTPADMDKMVEVVRNASGLEPSAPQKAGDTQILIKIPLLEDEGTAAASQRSVIEALMTAFPEMDSEDYSVSFVGASVGADLQRAAILSVIVASVLILFYIAIRFQFSSGLASVIAQLHDVAVLLAFYIVLRIPINMTFIAVLLTTLGYQINATVILFDRVRENRRRMQRTSFSEIIDRSIKQTLSRNINTTLTTLLPVVCIIILGVPSVRVFAIPIAIGLVVGAYSSITLSGSLWYRIGVADDRATRKLEEKTKG